MLTSVEIRGYKSCTSTDLQVGQPLVALVGKNGVGKTNLMQGISWATTVAIASGQGESGFLLPFQPLTAATLRFRLAASTYSYELAYSTRAPVQRGVPTLSLSEQLSRSTDVGPPTPVFQRRGEVVTSPSRNGPINIGATASAIGAVTSLLPSDDPLAQELRPVRDFLKSLTYYTLDDRLDATDFVSDSTYKNWIQGFESGGPPSTSVSVRLLYMYDNNRTLFDEVRSLLGPNGLDLIDEMAVGSTVTAAPPSPSAAASGPPEQRRYVVFVPGRGLGGAGRPLFYSNLSAGTRRIVRMVVFLLFDHRSVMLLEQPEDSIHVGLLHKILNLFRIYSDRTQLLFSTHSSEILKILRPEEIRLVTSVNGNTHARALTIDEVSRAKLYLKDEGTLADYLDGLGPQ